MISFCVIMDWYLLVHLLDLVDDVLFLAFEQLDLVAHLADLRNYLI
jgi:hypothetical protein